MSAENNLAINSLHTRHVAVMAMAATGPAATLALNFGFMASVAGSAFVLALVATLVAIVLLSNTLVQFSHRYPSAGSVYTWQTRGFGQKFGFVVGWLFAGSYILLAAGGSVVIGYWGEVISETAVGFTVPWYVWTIGAVIFIAALAMLGVSQSTKSMFILFGFEFVVIVALAVWILVDVGPGSWTLAPFQPSSAKGGWAAIGLAMTFGVLSCVGLEEGTTLAEETKDAERAVGRGVLAAAIVIPATYVLVAYAMAVGLGDVAINALDPATADPVSDLTHKFWGSGVGTWLLLVSVLLSMLAFTQSAFNAGARVLFALGRERVLPGILEKTHPTRKSPQAAVLVVVVLSLVLGLPLAIGTTPLTVWIYYGFMISIMFLLIYGSVSLALIVDTRRNFPAEFHIVRHFIIPSLAFLAMCYPLYRTVWPAPDSPMPLLAGLVIGWVALGAAVMAYLVRTRPDFLRRAGAVMAAEEEELV